MCKHTGNVQKNNLQKEKKKKKENTATLLTI
jgi:hypothetical protein